ncbi:hypothetical protein [Paenibacillus sabinae]|uniref:Lipoprotein n=1 Tax=Paenibacillus sabinae T27 TaxID=1268072 RepID=X4ZXT2_9BACL|nr:hypothetical protein [Paenibacillus sabinae]AHV97018.1 hypothetical protein PSAB_10440 [Paenibacillus sabinae T27]
MLTIRRLGKVGAIYAVLLMAGCSLISGGKDLTYDKEQMYNNNAAIVQEGDQYSYFLRKGSTTSRIADIEFKGFSGTDTIWILNVKKKADIRIDYSLTVGKGEFKVVLVTPSEQASTIAEGSGNGVSMVTLDKGKNRIKFVGKHTAGKVEMHLQAGDAVNITKVSDE